MDFKNLRVWLLATCAPVVVALALAQPVLAGPAEPPPAKKALAISDPNVVSNAVRVRLTKGTWSFLKVTLRDTFKQWGSPKRDANGFNLLLDPGYDYATKTAGPLRTTPLERMWAYSPGFRCGLLDCNGGSGHKYNLKWYTENWLQVRKPATAGTPCNMDNTVNGNWRGNHNAELQALHKEHGFYVIKEDWCFNEIEVCSPGSGQTDIKTPHPGHDPGATCTMAPVDAGMLGIYAEPNIGVFLYPQGAVESWPTPLEPTYNPPDHWSYTGFTNRYGLRESSGGRNGSNSCDVGICSWSTSWAPNWVASKLPTAANYDPLFAHHTDQGTYFRAGDDQALYLNLGQMQVQSIDRIAASNIWFRLRERNSNLCVNVAGGSTANNTNIELNACSTSNSQKFQYDSGSGNLRSRLDPTKCISYVGRYDTANLVLFNCTGDATHFTAFDRNGEGFKNRASTYAVTVFDKTDGTPAVQWPPGLTTGQNWEEYPTGFWYQIKPNHNSGQCIDIEGGVEPFANGTKILYWDCHGGNNQLWFYDAANKLIRARNWTQCLDMNGAPASGRELVIYTCGVGGRYQQFERGTDLSFRPVGSPGLCMNAAGAATRRNVILWNCSNPTSANNEKWNFVETTQPLFMELRYRLSENDADSKCLGTVGGVVAAGAGLEIAPCGAGQHQQWLFELDTGFFRLRANSNMCLSHDSNNFDNAPLTIAACANDAQRFERNGTTILVGNAFYMTGTGVANGANVNLFHPTGGLNQQFEQLNEPGGLVYQPYQHDCGDINGQELVYDGSVSGQDWGFFRAPAVQCVRPKSYWSSARQRWTPCDPFDTFLSDGTLNPANDDNKLIYPGSPTNTSRTCGAAPNVTDPGGGWYALKLDDIVLRSDAAPVWEDKNTIALQLTAKDLRIEAGFWIDMNLTGSISGLVPDPKRKWALGVIRFKSLVINAKVKLYSVDSSSCLTSGGLCDGNWYPHDNSLEDPDRLIVEVQLTKDDIFIELDNPSYDAVSDPGCFVYFVACVMQMSNLMPTIVSSFVDGLKDVLIPAVDSAVSDAVASLPELNTVLGNPLNMGRSLIDVGLYATPSLDAYATGDPTPGRKWPVRIFDGPGGAAGGRQITDLRMAMGFKPIPFRPAAGPNNFMQIDTNDPPLADSIYGVPTLVDPDTSTCSNVAGGNYSHTIRANGGSYSYNNSTGVMTMSFSTGSYGVLKAGYVIRDISTGKTATIKAVGGGNITLPPGLVAYFDGNGWEVSLGVISGLSGLTKGNFGLLVAGQVFRDDSSGQSVKIDEVITASSSLIVPDYNPTGLNGGPFTVLNCSRDSNYPAPDADQMVDEDHYVVTGSFTDPRTGQNYVKSQVIKEYWQGPIAAHRRSPTWCTTPQDLRAGSTPPDLAALYPQTTWLSFDSTWDKKTSGGPASPRNTLGEWDQMPPNTVLRQNTNSGALDPGRIGYDFSVHLHQRTLASLAQAIIASGSACLEFAAHDTTGAETPWKSLLATNRFAAFVPELQSLFPNQFVSVRLFPTRAPHIRTGMGRLSFVPEERLRDPNGGPLPIINERYTLAAALPDLRIEFWVQDSATATEHRVISMYWSTVVGFFVKSVRQCYKLDPLYGTPQCTSTQTNVRTASGYYELFFDINAPALQTAFENGQDGFAPGSFSTPGIGTTRGESAFVVDSTYCQTSDRCDTLGLAQSVPLLLSSLVQGFLVTRLSFMNLALDVLYVGPDGPNDDLVGGGDYLGIYARMLGNLNILDLVGSIGMAPRYERLAKISLAGLDPSSEIYFSTRNPVLPVELQRLEGGDDSVDSLTYSLDDGFWHTPVAAGPLELQSLTEGRHKLALRSINDSTAGAVAQIVPKEIYFHVDTLAPTITLGKIAGRWRKSIEVRLHDLQTPASQIAATYTIDGGKARELSGEKINLDRLAPGKHVVRVEAYDLAGNKATAAREIHLGGGCATGTAAGALPWLLVLMAGAIRLRRRV